MTTQTTAPAPLTTPRALAQLQDAMRAELREQLAAELAAWWASHRDDYVPGGDVEGAIEDAITTLTTGQ